MHIQRTANTHNVYFLSPVNSLNSALKHKFTENCHCAAMRMDDDSITSTIAVREQRKKMVTRQKARRIVTPQNNTCLLFHRHISSLLPLLAVKHFASFLHVFVVGAAGLCVIIKTTRVPIAMAKCLNRPTTHAVEVKKKKYKKKYIEMKRILI